MPKKYLRICASFLFAAAVLPLFAQNPDKAGKPLRVGVVGLVHTHVHWILGREKKGDIEVVGIAEPNRELARQYAEQHGYSMDIVFDSIDEMIEKTKPEAVTAFNRIYDHLETVQKCAPLGIHVMVEKPLAISMEHATEMARLARENGIHLLTNYETTWYGSNHEAKAMVDSGKIGELRKIVVHDGHFGPQEIGVNPEFLEWLTDPKWNGAGALTDFGCYGANLITWLVEGQKPTSVTCVTQTLKPAIYPKVDDEATIILTYPGMQGIIQASWNWPYHRKDIEIYGKSGYIINPDRTTMRLLENYGESRSERKAENRAYPHDDPFAYLAAVVRGKIKIKPSDLSALENNLVVMEILDAAMRSAREGKTVELK